MEGARVISVNPSQKTAGAINVEKTLARTTRIAYRAMKSPNYKEWLNFVTGINSASSPGLSVKLFLLRLIAAGIFMIFALSGELSLSTFNLPTLSLIAANIILFGFVMRPLTMALAIYLGITTAYSIAPISFDYVMRALPALSTFWLALFSFILALFGPGKASIDALFRHLLFRANRRSNKKV